MNRPEDETTWDAWLAARREVQPDERLARRVMAAVAEDNELGTSPAGEVCPADTGTQRDAPSSGWERSLQGWTEQSWGGLSICIAALLLGMTPYIGALVVFYR